MSRVISTLREPPGRRVFPYGWHTCAMISLSYVAVALLALFYFDSVQGLSYVIPWGIKLLISDLSQFYPQGWGIRCAPLRFLNPIFSFFFSVSFNPVFIYFFFPPTRLRRWSIVFTSFAPHLTSFYRGWTHPNLFVYFILLRLSTFPFLFFLSFLFLFSLYRCFLFPSHVCMLPLNAHENFKGKPNCHETPWFDLLSLGFHNVNRLC